MKQGLSAISEVKAALTSRFRFNWRTNELAGLKVSNWAS